VPRVRTTALAVLATALLTGCGSGSGGTGAAVASGNAASCPGKVLDVVVSVGQWGDLVRRLGGDCANVTTIVASAAVDPHDFDPSTSDLAAFAGADVVVLNGAGYDHWAEDAVAAADPEPATVTAAAAAGVPGRGADPHLWYDPEAVQSMAAAVTEELSALDPDAAAYLADRATAWTEQLQPYLAAVEQLRATAAGHTYAATETVFDRMAAAVGLTDVTPAGYRRSASNESEPAPGDLTAFETALGNGSIDVLVYNTQTSGNVPEQLRSAAEDAHLPVVEVTESPSDVDSSFVSWQLGQLTALSVALGGNR
jgi:zinc/manganese transport system substrate-binding protein